MALGQLQNEADLQRWLEQYLDTLGLNQPDGGAKDGSIAKSKLGTDALNAFLKLAVVGDVHVAVGSVTCTWAGGSRLSGTTTQAHGLKNSAGAGVTPAFVGYGSKSGALGTDWGTTAADGTNITTQADNTDGTSLGAATNRSAYWIAIG